MKSKVKLLVSDISKLSSLIKIRKSLKTSIIILREISKEIERIENSKVTIKIEDHRKIIMIEIPNINIMKEITKDTSTKEMIQNTEDNENKIKIINFKRKRFTA